MDSEAVLLVNDNQPQVLKFYVILKSAWVPTTIGNLPDASASKMPLLPFLWCVR